MTHQFLNVLIFCFTLSISLTRSYGVQEEAHWVTPDKSAPSTPQACKQRPDHYWNLQFGSCLPCTRCHSLGLLTLRGCAPNKDVVCGTMQDFQKQMEEEILRRGRKEEKRSSLQNYRVSLTDDDDQSGSDQDDEEAVYGKPVRYTFSKNRALKRRKDDATQKIRQTVRNASQRKTEFLRQIQEEENLPANTQRDKNADNKIVDTVEGQVRFAEEDEASWRRSGDLHDDLRLIENELLNGGFEREKENDDSETTQGLPSSLVTTASTVATTTTTSTTTTSTQASTTSEHIPTYAWPPPLPTQRSGIFTSIKIRPLRTTTSTATRPTLTTSTATTTTATATATSTLPLWLRHDYSFEDEYLNVDDITGKKRFIPFTSFDNFGTDNNNDEVFGAVVKNPTEEQTDRAPDEFGLLSRLLYRNEDAKSNHNKSGSTSSAKPETSLHLTHALIAVGFLIGFSIVFGVGLIYTKFIRIRRFKLLDNRASNSNSMGDASVMASRTSSFQRSNESRLETSPDSRQALSPDTRLATSPLISRPQTPQLGGRTVVAAALEVNPPQLINEPSLAGVSTPGSGASSPGYPGGHPSYVDYRGRTVLRPVRELPV